MSNNRQPSRGELFVVSAPSAAGKSTLISRLFATAAEHRMKLAFSVSSTTRRPRAEETHGEHYDFVDREGFAEMVAVGEFLEWATVHGELYGTKKRSVERLLATGADVILDIDVQGAAQVRAQSPDAVRIFIIPPSLEELERRLRERGDESPDEIYTRLQSARSEVARFDEYDYVIVNDDLEQATAELISVFVAHRRLTPRMLPSIDRILSTFRPLYD